MTLDPGGSGMPGGIIPGPAIWPMCGGGSIGCCCCWAEKVPMPLATFPGTPSAEEIMGPENAAAAAVAVAAATSGAAASSCGTVSSKKSQISVRLTAVAMSFLWRVRRLCSSAALQALMVSSRMKNSHALANKTGASALIMRTSSSDFII